MRRAARHLRQARPMRSGVQPSSSRHRRLRPLLLITGSLAGIALIPSLLLAPAAGPVAPAVPLPGNQAAAMPVAVSVVGGVVGAAPAGTLEKSGLASVTKDYQAALDAARAAADAPGVSAAVVQSGELVWAGASGTATDGTALTVDSPMVIGSVTKTFVAALILQLAEEGRLSVDATLAEYLPDLGMAGAEAITLRQLLNHTSGLADVFNETTRIGIEEDPQHVWTTPELIAALHEPWYAPGEDWAYANTNYLLLTLVAERVTGLNLEQSLTDRFLGPLGLDGSRLLSPDDGTNGPLGPAWTTIFRGSGAMVATADDLALWGDALYGGPVLLPRTREMMLDFNANDHGLGVQRLEAGGVEGYGHTGLLHTYTTLLLHVPHAGVTIAVLVDHDHAELG
ncbi:MAG: serine hydrolase domain-containing protein, partial [Candidatus Limnocylindria bacterium]